MSKKLKLYTSPSNYYSDEKEILLETNRIGIEFNGAFYTLNIVRDDKLELMKCEGSSEKPYDTNLALVLKSGNSVEIL